jgi:hypothetical protein
MVRLTDWNVFFFCIMISTHDTYRAVLATLRVPEPGWVLMMIYVRYEK